MQIASKTSEPIPGYKVQKRIGAGGYGEVWTVEAPGGLDKAIKFVYGYLDEERASREMKALNRIKSVRHPFLISLERIEVVEGQLVIITELAEGSLKDRFDQCLKDGLPGIPRDELLTYVRDAADALDYMSDNYSLQHLDVKPENLLLVGRHVKVADFGLVKELHEVTGSLMGGLTPLYAPPESFDGRPSRHSDQYSLAIVYQEMLTGVLPFPGTTAAQLAVQHLHSKPRVELLPPAEQGVLLKALSKDPADRFSSCTEMVDQLQRAGASEPPLPKIETDQLSPSQRAKVSATSQLAHISQLVSELKAEKPADDAAATKKPKVAARPRAHASGVRKSGWSIPPVAQQPEVESLPPLEVDETQFCLRPTLFVGLGGTAGQVLARLSPRLQDRFGGKTVPIMRSILLETDSRSMMQLAGADGNLDSKQVLILPLRRPQDYRNTSRSLLGSISRRWIYNIPRSQQTEGIRPLGRLALLDHAEKVMSRLREEIAAIVDSDAVAQTERMAKTQVETAAPRICIVSSISGGTGGGMLLDVAFAAKQILRQMGLADDDVHALLCHSTPRQQGAKDLAIANSYACLSELQHFSRGDREFPGDSGSGLERLSAGERVLKKISLLHLGEELSQRDFDAATQKAAEFLYLDSVTPCKSLFDRRDAERAKDQRQPWDVRIKTFGLFRLGGTLEDTVNEAAQHLCSQVIKRWRGESTDPQDLSALPTVSMANDSVETSGSPLHGQSTRLAGQKVAEVRLDQETLTALATTALESAFGADWQSCYARLREQATQGGSAELSPQAMLNAVDTYLGPRATELNQADELDESIEQEVQRQLAEFAGDVGPELAGWILKLLDRPKVRLKGAEQAADWIRTYLRDLQDKLCEAELQTLRDLSTIQHDLTDSEAKDKSKPRARTAAEAAPAGQDPAARFFQLRWLKIAIQHARKLSQSICVHVSGAADQLRDLGREFGTLQQQFKSSLRDSSVRAVKSPDELAHVRQKFRELLHAKLAELAKELDQIFCDNYLAPQGGMHSLVTADAQVRNAAPDALFTLARRIIKAAQQRIDCSELLLAPGGETNKSGGLLHPIVDGATPNLNDCGGQQWLTVKLPEQADRQRVAAMLDEHCQQQASFVGDADSDLVFLSTIDNIPLSQVATRLIDSRPDYAEAASRLYTRCDISWTPWDDVQP